MMTETKKTLLLAKEENGDKHGKADHHAQWPKIVIMLGMLVIILCGIRFAAGLSCHLFSHYLLLLFLTRW